jgi:LPXTG-site transpeptidase (sortase) family protein
MKFKLFAGLMGLSLGGSCTILSVLLGILAVRAWLEPVKPLQASEPAALVSWATPSPAAAAPLPLIDAPIGTPEAPLPTPEIAFLAPLVTPEAGQVANPATGGLATRLVIPALGLDTSIVPAPRQGDSWQVDHLGQSVGHLEGTTAPGVQGNIVLAGHYTMAETNGGWGPFHELKRLLPGDRVIVYRGEEMFEYIVDDFQTVESTAVEVTHSTDTSQLTLLTCSQWDRSRGEYTKRLVVKGHLL